MLENCRKTSCLSYCYVCNLPGVLIYKHLSEVGIEKGNRVDRKLCSYCYLFSTLLIFFFFMK